MEQVDRALRAGLKHRVKIGDRVQIKKIYDWGCGSQRYDSIFYFLIWQEHRLYQAHAQYKTLAEVMAAIKRWRPDLTNIDTDPVLLAEHEKSLLQKATMKRKKTVNEASEMGPGDQQLMKRPNKRL